MNLQSHEDDNHSMDEAWDSNSDDNPDPNCSPTDLKEMRHKMYNEHPGQYMHTAEQLLDKTKKIEAEKEIYDQENPNAHDVAQIDEGMEDEDITTDANEYRK